MTQQYPPPQSPPAHYGPPPQKPAKARKWPWIAGIVVAFLLGIGFGSAGSNAPSNTASTGATKTVQAPPSTVTVVAEAPAADAPAPAAPQQVDPPAKSSGPASSFANGQWSAPDEIQPGTYRSAGPEDSSIPLCYADTTPAAGGNIIEQQVSNSGPVRIRVKAGQIVKVSGCQDFTKVG